MRKSDVPGIFLTPGTPLGQPEEPSPRPRNLPLSRDHEQR
jgi:hypothetical protein